MTVLSQLRPGCALMQRAVFAIGRINPASAIRDLGYIHFARLAVIRDFPDHGQPPESFRHALQLFESNYNGTFDQYIDAFVDTVPEKLYAFWGTSYGFPLRLRLPLRVPLGPFKQSIHANELEVDHYYSAYRDASITMIGAALRVDEMEARFCREARELDVEAFADAYIRFVTDVQQDL